MPRLVVFNNVTVDGYFAAVNGDIDWAHRDSQDAEFQAFVADNAKGGGRLLFGRRTYELMTSYWPTPLAARNDPVLAGRMNALPKVVFSKALDHASWSNTRLVNGDIADAVRRMKREPGPDMVILGSGTIVSQDHVRRHLGPADSEADEVVHLPARESFHVLRTAGVTTILIPLAAFAGSALAGTSAHCFRAPPPT